MRHQKHKNFPKKGPDMPQACGKDRHPSEMSAISAALRASKRAGIPLRVYFCGDCKGYHLTKRVHVARV